MSNFRDLVTIDDLKNYAATHLDKNAFDYFSTGAGDEVTLHENRQAFKRIKLRPRVLRNVSQQDISVTVLGQKLSMPICVSPVSFQAMAHPDGELATLRAVKSVGTAVGVSIYSTYSLEHLARDSPTTIKFMQIQLYTDRQFMVDLLKRAEKEGYKAIFLTVDVPVLVFGRHKDRANFSVPNHLCGFANFSKSESKNNDQMSRYVEAESDSGAVWETFDWLRSMTSLPFVIKGISTPEDARLAVQHGAQGILVSNHGGRQLDGLPATIEVLPEIVEAVRGTGVEVYLDSGVRLGTDVLKALALGARAVFVGRPVIWGLAYKGEQGVSEVLQKLKDELKIAMALAGS